MTQVKEEYRETWAIVPRTIWDLPGITLAYLRVFETIFQFWNKGRQCFLSNPEIEKRTGVKTTQVKEAIAFFEKNNELERVQIGLRRYLVQPVKMIEIPGIPSPKKEVAGIPATCTNVTQVAGGAAIKNCTSGRRSGYQVAGIPATEIKKRNKEEINTPISPKRGKGDSFSFSEMIKDNPFKIPENMIKDFLEVRKGKHAKITETAWKRINHNLDKLKKAGLSPIECFETAVASGWSGIEVRYFERDIEALKPKAPQKYPSKEQREAEKAKIEARERAAEQRKKEEIEAAKGFKDIVKQAKEHIPVLERLKRHQEQLKENENERHATNTH